MEAPSAFQKVFRCQTQARGQQVLHKHGPWRVLGALRQATEQSICKPLILFIILKITGQISRDLYIPEYADRRETQSSSQSYPQK
jgi:hypothetical protein